MSRHDTPDQEPRHDTFLIEQLMRFTGAISRLDARAEAERAARIEDAERREQQHDTMNARMGAVEKSDAVQNRRLDHLERDGSWSWTRFWRESTASWSSAAKNAVLFVVGLAGLALFFAIVGAIAPGLLTALIERVLP